MDVFFDNRAGAFWNGPEDWEALLTKVILAGLSYDGCGHHFEISVSIVGPEEIRALNQTYRQQDRVTDVLSFPFYDELPGPPSEGGPPGVLGDIVICASVMKGQAREYRHSESRELAFLAIHGLLHLLGYDHESPEDEKEMIKAQEEILQSVGIPR